MFGIERTEKKVYNEINLYDRSEMEAYLEKQAQNGWLLYEYSGYYWKFRRVAPQKLRYCTVCVPKMTADKVEEFREYCAQDGWQFVAACECIQVFCSELEDPVPIETDPVLALDTVKRLVDKRMKKSWLTVLVLGFLYFGIFILNCCNHFTNTLLNHRYICVTIAIVCLVLLLLLKSVYEALWYRKARVLAERCGEIPHRKHNHVLTLSITIILSAIALYGEQGPYNPLSFLEQLTFAMYVVCGFDAGKFVLKYDMKHQRKATRIFSIVAFVVLLSGKIILSELAEDWQEKHEARPPVVVADICEIGDSDVSEEWTVKESLLVGRYDWQEFCDIPGSYPRIRYTITKTMLPILHQPCLDDIIAQYSDWNTFTELPAEVWQAQQVYVKTNSENARVYVVCYDKCIVELQTSWELTEEQIAMIAEKLKGF